ncbi:hypothetical protein DFH28DRAFT_1157589 [Melampsora americana]|nr:hypothetical protein DFH28DRAFT_1157589 [Melampsora americana]
MPRWPRRLPWGFLRGSQMRMFVHLAFGPHPARPVWTRRPGAELGSRSASTSAPCRLQRVDNVMVVQLAPGDFHTVREVEENGWMLPARVPLRIPTVPQIPVTPATPLEDLVANAVPVRQSLKRPSPSGGFSEHVSKRVATSQMSTRYVHCLWDPVHTISSSLASTNDSATPIANLIKITEVDQCPDFWAMPVHELKNWRQSVVILDRTIQAYFQQALKDAEDDLERAAAEEAVRNQNERASSGQPCAPDPGRKRALRAKRFLKEETPGPVSSNSPAFKFNIDGPNRLDLVYMRALDALSPFGAKGQKGKVFHECAIWLKNDAVMCKFFGNLSDSPNSRVLQSRYTQLKTWLAAAEGWSKMDSGTEEDDEELRHLIRSVQDEEETSRALRLAGQEEREAVKGRSLLAEAVREQFADKAVQDLESSQGDGHETAGSASSVRKGKRSASVHAKTTTDELTAFTGELGRWNEVSLAAQTEQNTRINQLYERELGIAHERNENERIMAQSLAAHRAAELELQQQRLEFEMSQMNVSNPALNSKANQKLEALEEKMGSMNDALAVIMKHLVSVVPSPSD